MATKRFALIFGIVFLLIGIAGFIPGLMAPHDHPDVRVTTGLGLLMGLFPVNVLHNVVHLLFGAWGLLAARSAGAAVAYAKAVGVIYALLAVLGFIPAANLHTTFGLVPLYGHDIWLHVLLAVGGIYFGFIHSDKGTSTSTAAADR